MHITSTHERARSATGPADLTRPRSTGGRTLTLAALAAVAAFVAMPADGALAAYSANVSAQTLRITGDGANDTLALRLQANVPTTLQVDVGADGTADFSFDRGSFTAIDVDAGAGNDTVRVDQTFG